MDRMNYKLTVINGGVGMARVYMDNYYIHIFDEKLPHSLPEIAIHDHPFSFDSTILQGVQHHRVYRAVRDDKHGPYLKIIHPTGLMIRLNDHRYRLETIEEPTYRQGDKYYMGEGSIHEIDRFEHVTISKVVTLTKLSRPSEIYMSDEQMSTANKQYHDIIAQNKATASKEMGRTSMKAY